MDYFCGIDIGASSAKLVIIDENCQSIGHSIRRSGINYTETSELCLKDALEASHLKIDQIKASLSTGYGRDNVPWVQGKKTEIACHGKGAFHNFSQAITVIDIGAQDNKVIHLDETGQRISFKMNRKCAAGTGSFLEEIALRLDLPVSRLNEMAAASEKEVHLGSFCTVFAATEILEKIRSGEKVEDIVKGAYRSVAKRIWEMDIIKGALVVTGGVIAHNPFLTGLIEEAFEKKVFVPPDPQFIGAFGSALYALENFEKEQKLC